MTVSYFLNTCCTKCQHRHTEQVSELDCDGIDFGKKMCLELISRDKKCEFCNKKTIHEINISREFSCGFEAVIKKEPKTVGHLAARNTERLGRGAVEDHNFKYKAARRNAAKKTADASGGKLIEQDKKAKPWWRDGTIPGVRKYDKPLDLPEIKNKEKYIRTGEID